MTSTLPRRLGGALRLGLSVALLCPHFECLLPSLQAQVRVAPAAGAWGQLFHGLSTQQTREISGHLGLDLNSRQVRLALIHVMNQSGVLPGAIAPHASAVPIAEKIQSAVARELKEIPGLDAPALQAHLEAVNMSGIQAILAGAKSWDERAPELTDAGPTSAAEGSGRSRAKPPMGLAPPVESVRLAKLVSFLRAINNLPAEQARKYRERYAEWFSSEKALARDMIELRRGESLPPARLDTAILNQAGEKDDAIVEIAVNGIDTSLRKEGITAATGRFGVGAFQSLQELERPGDLIEVETASRKGRTLSVQSSITGEPDPALIGMRIKTRLGSRNDPSFDAGTRVRVNKEKGLDSKRQEGLKAKLADMLGENTRMRINVNGQTINDLGGWKDIEGRRLAHEIKGSVEIGIDDNGWEVRDHGLGMSAETVLEKFLLPRQGGNSKQAFEIGEDQARSQTRLAYRGPANGRRRGLNTMEVTLRIAGVKVERFQVSGLNLPEAVLLELPHASWLPESRNRMAVTPELWIGLKALMEKIIMGDLEKNLGLLNALAAIGGYLENPRYHPESEKMGENFARFMSERLERVPGLKRLNEFQGEQYRAYAMKLGTDDVYLSYGRNLIFNEKFYGRHKDYPLLLNLLLNYSIGYGEREPSKGTFPLDGPREEKPSSPVKPDLSPEEKAVDAALKASPWHQSLKDAAKSLVRTYLVDWIARQPHKARAAALSAKTDALGRYAEFLGRHAPRLDWSAWLSSISDRPYIDETFDQISEQVSIDGKPAFTTLKGDRLTLYIDGKAVWTGSGYLEAAAPVQVAEGWALMTGRIEGPEETNRWILLVNGQERWRDAELTSIRPPPLIEIAGKPAFVRSRKNAVDVYVDGRLSKSVPKGDKAWPLLKKIGAHWLLVLRSGLDESKAFYLDGKKIWQGRIAEFSPQIVEYKGQAAWAAQDKDELWRLFINGKPSSPAFDFIGPVNTIEGDLIYMTRTRGKISVHRNGKRIWTDTSGRMRQIINGEEIIVSGGHWHFEATAGDRRFLVADGRVFNWAIRFFRNVFWIGDQVAYSTLNADHSSNLMLENTPISQGKFVERALEHNGKIVHLELTDEKIPVRFLHIDGKPVAGGSLSSMFKDLTSTTHGLFYTGEDKKLHRITIDKAQDIEFSNIENQTVRNFASRHRYDFTDAERPWGERYFRHLSKKLPGHWAELHALFPFLEDRELDGLTPRTIRGFADLAAKTPWDQLEEISRFIREARGLTRVDGDYDRWVNRWLDIVKADWTRAKELLVQLDSAHHIDKTAGTSVRGYDFLRPEHDPKQAPGHLRGTLYYLRSPRAELLKERAPENGPAAKVLETAGHFPLALLTIARRQRTRHLGDPEIDLGRYKDVLDSLGSYSSSNVDDEIASTIMGQEDQDSLVWVRELIQNSRDALRRSWREGALKRGEGKIEVDSFTRGSQWVVRVQDPVGMSLHKLVNYLFPLDASDRVAGLDAGRFGQGFYTIFGDFDEVRIKTSEGRGKAYEITVVRREGKLWVESFKETASTRRGTTIERVKRRDREQRIPVELEAAFVSQAVFENASLVRDADILYQGDRANEAVGELESLSLGELGSLRVLETASRLARVVQDSLSLSDPQLYVEMTALLPEWVRSLWKLKGWSLELPRGLPPVRSRFGLANKNSVMGDLQKAVLALGTKLAVTLYVKEGLPLPVLPEDMYYNRNYFTDAKTTEDASALNAGHWRQIDWTRYAQDALALGRLMALTEVEVGGERLSPWAMRRKILDREALTNPALAPSLQRTLAMAGVKLSLDALSGFSRSRSKEYTDKEISASRSLSGFRDLNFKLLEALGEKGGWTIRLHEHDDDEKASFQGKTISWNLRNNRPLLSKWKSILKGDDSQSAEFFYEFLETFIHEYTHFTENDWSHQADKSVVSGFAWRMGRNIERLIKAGLDPRELAHHARQRHQVPEKITR
ncbi:MAG: hypothetical protein AAB036_09485 [Elusimicrobiota bacterium]